MDRWTLIFGLLVLCSIVTAPEPAVAENVLRWSSETEALTFDPHAAYTTPTIAETQQVYEPLVGFNSSYAIEPSLAIAWRLIDATSWEFDLRRGVRFHDGAPLTSEDVVFSLNRAVSSTSDYKDALPPITAVEAVDEYTVRITTQAPDPILPDELGEIFIMSKRWAEQHDALLPAVLGKYVTHADRHANGTGPFKLVSFEPGVGSVMSKNYEWWGLGQDPHNIDRIVHAVMKDPAERLQAVLNGDVDLVIDPPLADLDQIERMPGVKLERIGETRTIFLGLDQGSQELRSSSIEGSNPFADLRVRQAVYQAIDEEAIQDKVMNGLAVPAGIIIQPGINGYAPDLDTRLPFKPDVAKSLLAAAGYPDGFDVTLDCPNDRYVNDEAICRAVATMLAQIGIRVTVAARPMSEHLPMIRDRETDFYMLGWGQAAYDSLSQFNYLIRSDGPYSATGYANPEVDDKIDSIATELVTYARNVLIEQVWNTVRADIVYVPLHHQVIVWAMRDRLELPIDPSNQMKFRLARIR